MSGQHDFKLKSGHICGVKMELPFMKFSYQFVRSLKKYLGYHQHEHWYMTKKSRNFFPCCKTLNRVTNNMAGGILWHLSPFYVCKFIGLFLQNYVTLFNLSRSLMSMCDCFKFVCLSEHALRTEFWGSFDGIFLSSLMSWFW